MIDALSLDSEVPLRVDSKIGGGVVAPKRLGHDGRFPAEFHDYFVFGSFHYPPGPPMPGIDDHER